MSGHGTLPSFRVSTQPSPLIWVWNTTVKSQHNEDPSVNNIEYGEYSQFAKILISTFFNSSYYGVYLY